MERGRRRAKDPATPAQTAQMPMPAYPSPALVAADLRR